jgi:AraC family transcriptional regulator
MMQPHAGSIGQSGLMLPADTRISYRDRAGLCDWQFKRVMAFLSIRIDSAVRVSDLAAEVKLSPGHFARAFTIRLGLSPYSFIMKLRIERASALLLNSDKSLAEIAFNCGLSDQAHFSRLFRRFAGMTPTQWRRQHMPGRSRLSCENDNIEENRLGPADHGEQARLQIRA